MHPGDGIRLPGEIGTQRTAVLPQSIRTTFSTPGSLDLVMCRDSVFPLWGERVAVVTPECYQLTWMGDPKSSTTGYASSEYIQMDCSEVANTWVGPSTTSFTRIPNSYGFPAAYPVAVMPELDKQPWLWVPLGAQTVVGLNFGSGLTSGSLKAGITFERAMSPSFPLQEATITGNAITAGAASSCVAAVLTNGLPTGSKGLWLRCKRIDFETTTATGFVNAYQPLVCVAVVTGTGPISIGAATASADFPAISGSTPNTCFVPIVNLDNTRSSITASAPYISRANRVVGTSLEITNTTGLMNIDGYFACVTYPESGSASLAIPPTDSYMSTILDSDKFNTRMANDLYTFVKPGRELSQFQDSRYEFQGYGGSPTAPQAIAVINLYMVQNYNLIRCVDIDPTTTTQLLLTLRSVLEFVTNDILLRPQYPTGTIVDTQQAVNMLRSVTPFWTSKAGPTHKIIDDSTVPGERRARRRPAQNRPRQNPPAPQKQKKKVQPTPKKAAPRAKQSGLSMFLASKPETRGHVVKR